MIIGAVATTFLIVRVLLQKRRVGQREIWRRNRKMVVQLASISIMYIITWIPSVVCYVVPLFVSSPLSSEITAGILNYVQYIPVILCPFMSLVGLPEIRQSVIQMLTRLNQVQPVTLNPAIMLTILPSRQQRQNRDIHNF